MVYIACVATPARRVRLHERHAARGALDSAARGLAGEQVDQPMDMGGMGDEEIPAELPEPELSDLDADEFSAADAAAGGSDDQGRERR